jgi:hypothetical protein
LGEAHVEDPLERYGEDGCGKDLHNFQDKCGENARDDGAQECNDERADADSYDWSGDSGGVSRQESERSAYGVGSSPHAPVLRAIHR